MKITRWMRIVLIALSVVMALSLFACGEPEETTTAQREETTDKKPAESTEAKDTDTTESKKAPETEESESNAATTDGEITTEGQVTTEGDVVTTEVTTESGTATTESGSETTETQTETDTDTETMTEESTACVHSNTHFNSDCDEICDGCGEILGTEVHPEHTEEYVDGADFLRTYTIKCAVCGKGLYEYSIQLGSKAPELIITADALALMAKANGERVVPEMSADGSYVTLNNTPGVKDESYFTAYLGDGGVTGQYMLIKYRTSSTIAQQFWVGANNGNEEPTKGDSFYLKPLENNSMAGFVADGEWRVTVVDLAKVKEGKFNSETEGENAGKYCADYIRWDVFDMGSKSEESVDVAYIALADNITELLAIESVREYVYVQGLLGGYAIAEPLNAMTDNPFFDPEFIAIRVGNESIATVKKDEANNGMPYVELLSNADTGEQKVTLWSDTANMIKNSGNYIGVLYRRTVTDEAFDIFINSNLAGPHKAASKAGIKTVADGTWLLKLIDISGLNKPDAEAYYDPALGISSFRFDYFNGDRTVGETIDIAFIGTFDTEEQAAEVLSAYYQNYFNGGAQICKHTSVENVSYVSDNDENTVLALEKFDCLVCGQKDLIRHAAFGAALETVDADAHISSSLALLKVENCVAGVWTVGGRAYPAAGYVTPSAEGTVTANGWVGVNGDLLGGTDKEALGAAYMIVDEEGNVLQDWTEVSANFAGEQAPITDSVKLMGHGIAPVGRRFKITADVSSFAGQTVNVIYAVIPVDIPEGSNDKYVPIIEIHGVQVPSAE